MWTLWARYARSAPRLRGRGLPRTLVPDGLADRKTLGLRSLPLIECEIQPRKLAPPRPPQPEAPRASRCTAAAAPCASRAEAPTTPRGGAGNVVFQLKLKLRVPLAPHDLGAPPSRADSNFIIQCFVMITLGLLGFCNYFLDIMD